MTLRPSFITPGIFDRNAIGFLDRAVWPIISHVVNALIAFLIASRAFLSADWTKIFKGFEIFLGNLHFQILHF